MAAVKQKWQALQYAAPEIRKDKDLLLVVVKLNIEVLYYADKELKKDRQGRREEEVGSG